MPRVTRFTIPAKPRRTGGRTAKDLVKALRLVAESRDGKSAASLRDWDDLMDAQLTPIYREQGETAARKATAKQVRGSAGGKSPGKSQVRDLQRSTTRIMDVGRFS